MTHFTTARVCFSSSDVTFSGSDDRPRLSGQSHHRRPSSSTPEPEVLRITQHYHHPPSINSKVPSRKIKQLNITNLHQNFSAHTSITLRTVQCQPYLYCLYTKELKEFANFLPLKNSFCAKMHNKQYFQNWTVKVRTNYKLSRISFLHPRNKSKFCPLTQVNIS